MPADSYAVAIPVGEISRPRRAEQGSGNQNPTLYRNMRGSLAAQGNRIDDTSLIREAQQGNRAAFEVLTQSRERFYPVDAYVVDLCLLDPALPKGSLDDALAARAPVTFLAPAKAIEAQAAIDPEGLARLCEAITEGWADVVGGAYDEVDEPLLPVESILWQLRRGYEV